MKSLSTKLNESFFNNVGAGEGRLWETYVFNDGFQFGWSAHISDKQWFPIFDMNFLRNYYQKYMDPNKLMRGLCSEYLSIYNWKFKKYSRTTKDESFFEYCRFALAFAILSAHTHEPDEKEIKKTLSKFLNKENGADKDTEIRVEKSNTTGGLPSIKVFIKNDRVGYVSRPLWLEFVSKSDINRSFE